MSSFQGGTASRFSVNGGSSGDSRLKTEDVFYNVQNPNIDLESYVQQYTGLTRIQRLAFIAKHCPPLRVEVLKLAIRYVQMTHNTTAYIDLEKQLSAAQASARNDHLNMTANNALSIAAKEWVNIRTKKGALTLEKLDTDLKNYKSNSIKESIRRGHDDLGDHYLDSGDLPNALKSYSRARDYCTSGR